MKPCLIQPPPGTWIVVRSDAGALTHGCGPTGTAAGEHVVVCTVAKPHVPARSTERTGRGPETPPRYGASNVAAAYPGCAPKLAAATPAHTMTAHASVRRRIPR